MTNDELLPCPFQRNKYGEPEEDHCLEVVTGEDDLSNITCWTCEYDAPQFKTLEEAVSHWNHRIPHPDTAWLDWCIKKGAVIESFKGKYRVACQTLILSEWVDSPREAIDNAMKAMEADSE